MKKILLSFLLCSLFINLYANGWSEVKNPNKVDEFGDIIGNSYEWFTEYKTTLKAENENAKIIPIPISLTLKYKKVKGWFEEEYKYDKVVIEVKTDLPLVPDSYGRYGVEYDFSNVFSFKNSSGKFKIDEFFPSREQIKMENLIRFGMYIVQLKKK